MDYAICSVSGYFQFSVIYHKGLMLALDSSVSFRCLTVQHCLWTPKLPGKPSSEPIFIQTHGHNARRPRLFPLVLTVHENKKHS